MHIETRSLSRRRLLKATAALPAASVFPAFAQAGKTTTVTIAHFPIAGLAPVFVGEQQGFFKAEGITLQRETARLPSDIVANLIGGRLQIGFINVGGLAQAAVQGLPLKVTNSLYFNGVRDNALHVRSDSPIKTMAGVEGKSVALAQLKNNYHAAVLGQIESAGVKPDSVKFSLVPMTNTVSALRSGSVDIAQIGEPFASIAGDEIRSICDNPLSVLEKRSVVAHTITTQQFAKDQPEVLAAFARAMNKSLQFAGQNSDAVRKAVGSYTEIKPDVLSKISLPEFSPELGLDSVDRQLDLMLKYKILPSKPDMSRYFA